MSEMWNKKKIAKVKDFILKESKKQSPERKLRNDALGEKYKKEDKELQTKKTDEKAKPQIKKKHRQEKKW